MRWYIRLRNFVRAAGLLRVVRWWYGRKTAQYRREYQKHRPTTVALSDGEYTGEFLAADESEYVHLRLRAHDRNIIRTITRALSPGDILWDIGANVGVYSVLAARAVGENGHVLAFEPEPGTRARLLANTEANGLNNVEVVPVALGAESNTFRMLVNRASGAGSHRLLLKDETAPEENVVDVRVVPGDDFRMVGDLEVPAVVKIDVEGAEMEVLQGLLQTLRSATCRAVVCEVHFAILNARGLPYAPIQISDLLLDCGFEKVEWIDRTHLVAFKQVGQFAS